MELMRIETTVRPGHRIIVDDVPLESGHSVEVIIRDAETSKKSVDSNPLKGSVLRYDRPFDPATDPEDWEVLR